MAVDGINKWTPLLRKAAEIPLVSTRFSLSVANEQADAGRDVRTCLTGQNSRPMRGNAMGWYYHHKWDGNGMGWDGSRNFVPITSYHPITITVICTTHQLPVGGMSALYQPINCQLVVCLHYTIPSTFPSHHPELLPIPSTTHL